MTTGICVIHRIVIAIAILVQAIDGFGVEISGVVGGDKAAPFGRIVPGVAVIQAGIIVVVIAAITNRVGIGNGCVGGAGSNGAVANTYILPNIPPAVKKKPPRP